MDFIKNAGFGVQVAVVSGYLAAVKGHNVVKSFEALGEINKASLKNIENYKHVGGRILQTPFFLVGMVAGIVMDLISLVVNGAKYIGQAIHNVCVVLKAKVTGKTEEIDNGDFCQLNFLDSHKGLVDPKNVDTYNTKDTQSILDGKTVQSETPIADNVTLFNTKVCDYVASFTCSSGTGGTQ